jgi:hypothetical protein
VIVTLPQKSRLLAGNLVELYQHTLHSDVATIPSSSKDNRPVASCAQLLGLVDLETSHLEDVARNLVAISGHCYDIRLQLGLANKRLSLVDDIFN